MTEGRGGGGGGGGGGHGPKFPAKTKKKRSMILHRRILGTPEITFPPNYVQDIRSRVWVAWSAGGCLSLTLGCGVCARPKSSVSIKKCVEKTV